MSKGLKYGWWRREPFAIGVGVVAIVLCGAMIIWFGTAKADADDQPHVTDPVQVLVTGDSITHSQAGEFSWRYFLQKQHMTNPEEYNFTGSRSGPSTGPSGGWVPAAYTEYADHRFDYEHSATAGGKVCDPTHRGGQSWAAMFASGPDIVVQSSGVNDSAAYAGYQIAYCYGVMIQAAQAANPDVDFVLTKLPWGGQQSIQDFNALLPYLDATYTTATSEIVIAEMDTPYVIGVDTPAGDIHPNERGERKIAKMMAGGLEQLGVSVVYPDAPQPTTPTVYAQRFGGQVAVWWTYSPQVRYVLQCGGTTWTVKKWETRWVTMSQSPSNACRVTAYNVNGYSPWSAWVWA